MASLILGKKKKGKTHHEKRETPYSHFERVSKLGGKILGGKGGFSKTSYVRGVGGGGTYNMSIGPGESPCPKKKLRKPNREKNGAWGGET